MITDIKIMTGVGNVTIEQRRSFCKRRRKHAMELLPDMRSNGTRDWRCTICDYVDTALEGFPPNKDA
ncbi:hypothetical protein DF022_35395 [Burkholderia cepacia]|nr:hypothetical protein WK40_28960 [Burkholderia cepacia]RQT93504.1 hypothetical protein DF022_35395 [Burkholderia cepacia]RQZ93055.1 hypothetical protein DF055_35795 [Burkholderia cepacia]RQZ97608.1 hypothetical protein DF054_36345 [Burkholderia cepacia]